MLHSVLIEINTDVDVMTSMSDAHLANLWHVAQTNPAPYGDRTASLLVEQLGNEIVRRWLAEIPADRFIHQAVDQYRNRLHIAPNIESAQ